MGDVVAREPERRRWLGFGPEWNPVLAVLGVLAALCVLASFAWYLGVAGMVTAFVALVLLTDGPK